MLDVLMLVLGIGFLALTLALAHCTAECYSFTNDRDSYGKWREYTEQVLLELDPKDPKAYGIFFSSKNSLRR